MTVVVDLSAVTVTAFAAGTAPGAVTVAAPTLAEVAGPASATALTTGTAAEDAASGAELQATKQTAAINANFFI